MKPWARSRDVCAYERIGMREPETRSDTADVAAPAILPTTTTPLRASVGTRTFTLVGAVLPVCNSCPSGLDRWSYTFELSTI
jgi:hypothetical protein